MASIVGSLVPQQEGIPIIDVKIVDGSALVRCSCRCCSRCLLKAQTRRNRGAGLKFTTFDDVREMSLRNTLIGPLYGYIECH